MEKNLLFIRIIFWSGVLFWGIVIVKLIIFVATYDFCWLWYNIGC